MKILITGGTGLIGRAFINRMGQHQFTVLARSVERARNLLPESVTIIRKLTELNNLDGFDAVINLAGEPIIDRRWTKKQKAIICQSRWHITQQLVDLFACSAKPPEVFISGSAIGFYGHQIDDVITESSPSTGVGFPVEVCQQWENIAKQAEPFTRVVILRTGIVLAAHGGALKKMLLPFRCCLGGRIANGRHYMSWIHYCDMIKAIDYLLTETSMNGPVNLVAPEPVRNHEFTRVLAKVLRRIAIIPVPEVILKLLLGESSCLLTDSQKVYPHKLSNSQFTFRFPSLKLALANLLQD